MEILKIEVIQHVLLVNVCVIGQMVQGVRDGLTSYVVKTIENDLESASMYMYYMYWFNNAP